MPLLQLLLSSRFEFLHRNCPLFHQNVSMAKSGDISSKTHDEISNKIISIQIYFDLITRIARNCFLFFSTFWPSKSSLVQHRVLVRFVNQQSHLIFSFYDLFSRTFLEYNVNFQLTNYIYNFVSFLERMIILFFSSIYRTMELYHAGHKTKWVFRVNHVFSKLY